MLGYISFLVNKMMGFKENYIEHINLAINFDEIGAVKYESMDINIIPVLINSKTNEPIDLDEETRSHISLSYNKESYDITDGNIENYKNPIKEKMEAKACIEKDFDRSQYAIKKYKEYYVNFNYTPICPEKPEEIEFNHSNSRLNEKYLKFNIEKCTP